jgi:DNA-directed RNA polymerase alpha subunit
MNERERRQQLADALAPVRLSSRALGAMRRGEITSLTDLLGWTVSELLNIRAVGKDIAREIVEAVHEAGYAFWPDDAQSGGKQEP